MYLVVNGGIPVADCRLPDSSLSRFDSMETETLRRILQENQALQPESALSIPEYPAWWLPQRWRCFC